MTEWAAASLRAGATRLWLRVQRPDDPVPSVGSLATYVELRTPVERHMLLQRALHDRGSGAIAPSNVSSGRRDGALQVGKGSSAGRRPGLESETHMVNLGEAADIIDDQAQTIDEPVAAPDVSPAPASAPASRPRVAIAHDYLTQRGGAERVVLSLTRAFPDAEVYTSFYAAEDTYPEFAGRQHPHRPDQQRRPAA